MPRLLSVICLCWACGLSTPAWTQGHAAERQAILQAQAEIQARHGGQKLSQTWRGEQLLMVWQTRDGRTLLVRVDPPNRSWQILRDENPRRRR